jgi:hypothetical protein
MSSYEVGYGPNITEKVPRVKDARESSMLFIFGLCVYAVGAGRDADRGGLFHRVWKFCGRGCGRAGRWKS